MFGLENEATAMNLLIISQLERFLSQVEKTKPSEAKRHKQIIINSLGAKRGKRSHGGYTHLNQPVTVTLSPFFWKGPTSLYQEFGDGAESDYSRERQPPSGLPESKTRYPSDGMGQRWPRETVSTSKESFCGNEPTMLLKTKGRLSHGGRKPRCL